MSERPLAPASGPRIREEPEDFVVDEVPLYPASGSGTHTFLHVEKRLKTTDDVARSLARAAGVKPRDVGYAGRKDRLAVTRQWFSVPDFAPEAALALEVSGVRVLEATPHRHKLRTGQLRANRFDIRVRGVSEAHVEHAQEVAEKISREGMPNRFGDQRFGRDGTNAERGLDLLLGRARIRDKRSARFLISALQAAVFNRVLADRPLPLDRLQEGDVAVVNASGGLFCVEDVERECGRAAAFEISPTGPIFGLDAPEPSGEPALREAAAFTALGVPPRAELQAPKGIRLAGARRALRILPEALEMERAGDVLRLRFSLPPGSFATVLLEELGLQARSDD